MEDLKKLCGEAIDAAHYCAGYLHPKDPQQNAVFIRTMNKIADIEQRLLANKGLHTLKLSIVVVPKLTPKEWYLVQKAFAAGKDSPPNQNCNGWLSSDAADGVSVKGTLEKEAYEATK